MGSASGLHQLIDAHYQALYRFAFRLAGSAADAEDLTQETFGKALTRLSQLRDPERARGWLFRILRNAYLHRVRDQKRHRVIPLEAIGDLPERPADEMPEIDPVQLQHALNELDEAFRKIRNSHPRARSGSRSWDSRVRAFPNVSWVKSSASAAEPASRKAKRYSAW